MSDYTDHVELAECALDRAAELDDLVEKQVNAVWAVTHALLAIAEALRGAGA